MHYLNFIYIPLGAGIFAIKIGYPLKYQRNPLYKHKIQALVRYELYIERLYTYKF